MVQLNVSVASTVAPSRTVTATLYGLAPAAAKPTVPLMSPLAGSIDRPAGRPLAA